MRPLFMHDFLRVSGLTLALLAGFAFTSGAFAADKISFRLDWKIYGTHAPFFLAKERGYYAAEGIDVTISEGQGSATVAKLIASGSDQLGFVDYGTMAKGVVQGLPVKAVFGINQNSPMVIISHAKNPIKSPAELEGKMIAMSPAESTAQIFPALLAATGVNAKKVNVVNPAVGAKSALFLQHRVDAITAYVSVQVAQLEAKGAKVHYFRFSDFGVNTLSNGIVANTDFLSKNPDVAKRFLRATAKGWSEARKDPGAAVEATLKNYPMYARNKDVLARQLVLTFLTLETPNTKGKPLGWMSNADWEKTQTILLKFAGLKKSVPVSRYFTNDFVPK